MASYLKVISQILGIVLFYSSGAWSIEKVEETQGEEEILSPPASVVAHEDLLAAKLMIGAFHLFDQGNAGNSMDIKEPVHWKRTLFGYSFEYDYPALDEFSSWDLKVFRGHLGFYASYKHKGKMTKEYFGMVGFHEESNTIAVVFRGSRRVDEYFYNNLNCLIKRPISQRQGPSILDHHLIEGYHTLSFNGPIHAGYYNRVMTCQKSLKSKIQYFLNKAAPNPKLIITGHSLGGASACIMAGAVTSDEVSSQELPIIPNQLFPFKEQFSQISLIAFGAPRVSDHTYGPWLKEKGISIKNYVCKTDLIPSFPPLQIGSLHLKPLHVPTFDPIDEPIVLQSYGLSFHQIIASHDVRLYWRALADLAGVSFKSFPLFRISNDTPYMKKLLGFEEEQVNDSSCSS